jgi:two-component system, NtrC family, nitrogen regulation sensor histidine kinase GlnL
MSLKPSFNLLNTSILILDEFCHIVYLNNSAEQLFGFSDKQFKGQSLFNLIEADFDQKQLLQLIEQQQNTFIEDAHLKTHTGLIISNIMLSCFEQENQKYIQLELQSSEHHSHFLKDLELQQQSRVSNHLIRNLAHEIKNPLGGIKGAAQLLLRKLPKDFSEQYCQIIIQEADRLSELVNRLLLPAQPETMVLTNIHLILEKALEIVLLQNEKPIKILKDYDPSLPELCIAPGQIQQSFLNLLKNAVEALAYDTKIETEINTKVETSDLSNAQICLKTRAVLQHTIGNQQFKQVIKIDIIDNGCGIPEKLLKDIFYPTISGKNSSGLGLSIAQSLVQRHQGIIEVESGSKQTTFSIYLPVTQ